MSDKYFKKNLKIQKFQKYSLPLLGSAVLLVGVWACTSSGGQQAVGKALTACGLGFLVEDTILDVKRTSADAPLTAASLVHYAPRNAAINPAAVLNSGACTNNTAFKYGSGLGDITGPTVGQGMAGYADPDQISTGLHDRQFARAIAISSSCAGRTGRVVIVNNDIGLMFSSIKQEVINKINLDSSLAGLYSTDNILIGATHSHATAAGQAYHDVTNTFALGRDDQSLQAAVDGTFLAIKRAHQAMQAAPTGSIRFAQGELLNAIVNRSIPAYQNNPAAERAQFQDTQGREVTVNRMMRVLKFARNGTEVGMLSWFAIHGTSISQLNTLLSGDNKGYAAQRFEQDFHPDFPNTFQTEHLNNPSPFVAAMLQGDEGDNSPNIFITDLSEPELRDLNSAGFQARAGGRDDFENALISGYKQYRKAKDLYVNANEMLTGEIAARQILIDFSRVNIDAPRTYPSPYAPTGGATQKTCVAALGVSFGAGAEDGRGPTFEGQTCANTSPATLAATATQLQNGGVPPALITPVGCNNPAFNAMGYDCHAEKPILFPAGISPFDPTQSLEPLTLPVQIVVIGNFAIVALPWEVTTTSGRRIRNALLNTLQDAGVDYAQISGLANDYAHYLTTREEYAAQQYEGASTLYGPWTQEAALQEVLRLAGHIRLNTVPNSPYANPSYLSHPTSYVHNYPVSDGNGTFGMVTLQPQRSYQLGNTPIQVQAQFVAAHPRRDLKLGSSYFYIEKLNNAGTWDIVSSDHDWRTQFRYTESTTGGANTMLITWNVPVGVTAGFYRIRHTGNQGAAATPYEGMTDTFEIKACTS